MEADAGAVCPSKDQLVVNGVVQCPVEGCREHIYGSSRLQMHILRHHLGRTLGEGGGKKAASFYCPQRDCERGVGRGKPFPRLGQLKQHYQTVHANKSFTCSKCGKAFGLRDVHSRHERECGLAFKCSTCAVTFRSRNALYQHAKRKEHALPEGSKPRPKVHPSPPPSGPETAAAVVFRRLLQLPRLRRTQDVASQTEVPSTNESSLGTSLAGHSTRFSSGHPRSEEVPGMLDMATQIQPDFSDLATQTDLPGLFLQMPFPQSHSQSGNFQSQSHDQSLSSCQGASSQASGTQTAPGVIDQRVTPSSDGTGSSSLQAGVSVELSLVSQAVQTHAQPLACGSQSESVSQAVQTHPPPPSCEFSTQTPAHATDYELMLQSLVDFGTQTASTIHVENYDDVLQSLVDSSTQTTHAAHGTDYSDLLQSSVDFGTQTADTAWPLSLLEGAPLSPNLLPLECMDFGTQTLESSLLSLDFGVQFPTLTDHDTRDQGCQTTHTQ